MRRILDGKFYIENDQLVKASNGEAVPEDEPVFLFRARDYLAVTVLRHYLELSMKDGCTDYQLAGVIAQIDRFEAFAEQYPERMKQPGCTRGL